MKRTTAVLSALVLALGVSACGDDDTSAGGSASGTAAEAPADQALPEEASAMLADLGLDDGGVRETIESFDQLEQARPLAVQGSVRTDQVVFSDGQSEVAVPIPGDEVYVSVAPYVNQTHDCHFHALGSCQGEMVGEDVEVTITDAGGEVLVDETATTYANGFVGFWVPKDISGTIAVTQGDLTGEAAFDTHAEEATCITTLQLT